MRRVVTQKTAANVFFVYTTNAFLFSILMAFFVLVCCHKNTCIVVVATAADAITSACYFGKYYMHTNIFIIFKYFPIAPHTYTHTQAHIFSLPPQIFHYVLLFALNFFSGLFLLLLLLCVNFLTLGKILESNVVA